MVYVQVCVNVWKSEDSDPFSSKQTTLLTELFPHNLYIEESINLQERRQRIFLFSVLLRQ